MYVLRKPHINVFLWLGIDEQHPVLTSLLNHARAEVVLRRPLVVQTLCGSANQPGEVWKGVVAVVARDVVDGPAGWKDAYGDPETFLYAN